MQASANVERFFKDHHQRSQILRQHSGQVPPIAASFFSVIRIIEVDFQLLEDGASAGSESTTIPLKCVGNRSVRQIKAALLEKMADMGKNCDRYYEEGFVLTYELEDKTFEISDMEQTFQTLKIVNIWMTSKSHGKLDVTFNRPNSPQEKVANVRLGALMGLIWKKYDDRHRNDDEMQLTRRKLTNVRRRAVQSRSPAKYSVEPIVVDKAASLPPHIAANLDDNRFLVTVTYKEKNEDFYVETTDLPTQFISRCLLRFSIEDEKNLILMISGKAEYVWGEHKMIDFIYIRKCLTRRVIPRLTMCERPDMRRDQPSAESDPWNYVDESTGVTQNHQQLTILSGGSKNHSEVVALSLWDLRHHFRINLIGIDYLKVGGEVCEKPDEVYVEASLYQGTQRLCESVRTKSVPFTGDLRWHEWLELEIEMRNLPKEAKLNINIVGVYKTSLGRMKNKVRTKEGSSEQDVIISWFNKQIFDHRSSLCTGDCCVKSWPMIHNEDISFETYNATTESNTDAEASRGCVAEVHFQLDTYMHPVVFPNGGWELKEKIGSESPPDPDSPECNRAVEILRSSQLESLDAQSKRTVRLHGEYFKKHPDWLPKLLQIVDFSNLEEVVWIHCLIKEWPDVSFEIALELLDERYVDEKVRRLAVRQLERLSDQKLLIYMLQLTQALKFEPYHDSPLCRFLITRALQSKRIGHYFFWYLRSEIENPHVSRRYSVLLEAYLRGCGQQMVEEFSKQTTAINTLKYFSRKVNMKQSKQNATGARLNEVLRDESAKISLPATFQAPFDPRIVLGKLAVDKSKIMDSKKRPIWLEFANGAGAQNETGDTIKIIFKQGDDLRQDMLTLQMLTLMEQLWDEEGLDLCLLPYGCMSTGMQMGVIEIVSNANTVAKIQKEGAGLIRGAFKDEVLVKWLERKNPDPAVLKSVVETFMRSCAGYCVATYVLGIGDRHNDNIMVTETGNLFHIDFGHFLGNTKTFYGIQRERVPFVLTPDFVHVMGGEDSDMFQHFKENCIQAYLILRRNASLFLNLFHMMRSTGIPELNSIKDISYLRNVLLLDQDEEEARKSFLNEIASVLRKSWTVQVNWMMHGFAHSTNKS